ncbi:MAG: MraY family glycosyltransferase [Candidatus Nanopelagicales bacterium]|nr:MraY family glycosyltransferase [Candidatus Nanopelagicales bacterium]
MFTVNPWGALAIFVGTTALSGLLVWVSIAIAHRYEILDQPDGLRKIQSRPIPKLGGVAIAIAFSASAVLVLTRAGDSLVLTEALGILVPAIAAALVGYLDDKRGLTPGLRLALQAVVGIAIAWALHEQVHITGVLAIDLVIMVLWVMTLINGVNLLDNSDGLAGATVLISSLMASAVAGISGQYLIAALGVALAGTAAGFLLLNWNPARVYMGDSGAYFLGTMLAALTLQLKITTVALPWTLIVPLLLASLPLIDTCFVVISRLRQGIHPFTAGRDHLSHRLQNSGLSVGNSVLTLALFLLATGFAAIAITAVNT